MALTWDVVGADGADLGGDEEGENGFFSRRGGRSESDDGRDIVDGRKSNPGNIFFGVSVNLRGDGEGALTGGVFVPPDDDAFLKMSL